MMRINTDLVSRSFREEDLCYHYFIRMTWSTGFGSCLQTFVPFLHHEKKKQTIYDKFLPVATHAAHCIYQVSKTWGFNKTQEISYSELVFYTESAVMASTYRHTNHKKTAAAF